MQSEIFVIEDDPSSLAYMQLTLQHAGYRVQVFANPLEALLVMERRLPNLIVSDLELPEISGLEVLSLVRRRWPEVPVILVTVEHTPATIVAAVQAGAANYLVKPVAPQVLQSAVRMVLGRSAARLERDINPAPEIVGTSPRVVAVKQALLQAARTDVNVLITGETGTGKEMVARALHRLYGAKRPFVAYNCAATASELFESTFFGHKRGAFSGATHDHAGVLAEADGGLLFLDEVECLTTAHQAKLLRVLDSGEVRAVGSERTRTISVRFIAAMNRSPLAMIAAGALREDFYYRLCGFEISLPRLAERAQDVPELARHFLRASGKELTPAVEDALCRYAWPGNVRQLRNVLGAACARAGGSAIDLADLELTTHTSGQNPMLSVQASELSQAARSSESALGIGTGGSLALQDLERQAVVRALAECGGHLGQTARALGIHRSTLRRKLRDWAITLATSARTHR